jgi:hypothetical protein
VGFIAYRSELSQIETGEDCPSRAFTVLERLERGARRCLRINRFSADGGACA